MKRYVDVFWKRKSTPSVSFTKPEQQGSLFPAVCSGFLQIRLTITRIVKSYAITDDCESCQALIKSVHLVGGKTSMADVLLLECTLMLEERFCGILADFPNIKVSFYF